MEVHKWRTFTKYQPIKYLYLEAPEDKMSANAFQSLLTSPNNTATFSDLYRLKLIHGYCQSKDYV